MYHIFGQLRVGLMEADVPYFGHQRVGLMEADGSYFKIPELNSDNDTLLSFLDTLEKEICRMMQPYTEEITKFIYDYVSLLQGNVVAELKETLIDEIESKYHILHNQYDKNIQYDINDCVEQKEMDLQEFVCCVCTILFNKPILLACGHTLCQECCNSIISKKCPLCRESFNSKNIQKNISMEQVINKLIIKCNECDKYHELDYKCFVNNFNVQCTICKNSIKVNDFHNHLSICYLTQCKFCSKYIEKDNIEKHYLCCPKIYVIKNKYTNCSSIKIRNKIELGEKTQTQWNKIQIKHNKQFSNNQNIKWNTKNKNVKWNTKM
jgi:hypothetical protein